MLQPGSENITRWDPDGGISLPLFECYVQDPWTATGQNQCRDEALRVEWPVWEKEITEVSGLWIYAECCHMNLNDFFVYNRQFLMLEPFTDY